MSYSQEQQRYLEAMGIQLWHDKTQAASIDTPFIDQITPSGSDTSDTLDSIAKCVRECTACSLHKTRTQTVFGVGDPKARLLIIGEAPGATEDKMGQPFVGRAGQLLDEMLRAIGFNRSQVFIANILKCRPPSNRDPTPEEVAECTPFLHRQIALIKPELILALGRIAAHHLLKTNTPLNRLRGQSFQYGPQQTPLRVTYHPAYLLRSPQDKRKAYVDLLTVKRYLSPL